MVRAFKRKIKLSQFPGAIEKGMPIRCRMAQAARHQLLRNVVLIDRAEIDIRPIQQQIPHNIHAGKIRQQANVGQEQLEVRGINRKLQRIPRLIDVARRNRDPRINQPHKVVVIAIKARLPLDMPKGKTLGLCVELSGNQIEDPANYYPSFLTAFYNLQSLLGLVFYNLQTDFAYWIYNLQAYFTSPLQRERPPSKWTMACSGPASLRVHRAS